MRKLLVLFILFIPLACFSADSRNTSASTTFEFQAIKSFASPDTLDWSYSIEVVNRYGKSNDGVYSGEIIASEVERDIPVTDEIANLTSYFSLFDVIYTTNMVKYPMEFKITIGDFINTESQENMIDVQSRITPELTVSALAGSEAYESQIQERYSRDVFSNGGSRLDSSESEGGVEQTFLFQVVESSDLRNDVIKYPHTYWVSTGIFSGYNQTDYYYGEVEYKLHAEARLDADTNFADLSGTYKMNVQIEVSTGV